MSVDQTCDDIIGLILLIPGSDLLTQIREEDEPHLSEGHHILLLTDIDDVNSFAKVIKWNFFHDFLLCYGRVRIS